MRLKSTGMAREFGVLQMELSELLLKEAIAILHDMKAILTLDWEAVLEYICELKEDVLPLTRGVAELLLLSDSNTEDMEQAVAEALSSQNNDRPGYKISRLLEAVGTAIRAAAGREDEADYAIVDALSCAQWEASIL